MPWFGNTFARQRAGKESSWLSSTSIVIPSVVGSSPLRMVTTRIAWCPCWPAGWVRWVGYNTDTEGEVNGSIIWCYIHWCIIQYLILYHYVSLSPRRISKLCSKRHCVRNRTWASFEPIPPYGWDMLTPDSTFSTATAAPGPHCWMWLGPTVPKPDLKMSESVEWPLLPRATNTVQLPWFGDQSGATGTSNKMKNGTFGGSKKCRDFASCHACHACYTCHHLAIGMNKIKIWTHFFSMKKFEGYNDLFLLPFSGTMSFWGRCLCSWLHCITLLEGQLHVRSDYWIFSLRGVLSFDTKSLSSHQLRTFFILFPLDIGAISWKARHMAAGGEHLLLQDNSSKRSFGICSRYSIFG